MYRLLRPLSNFETCPTCSVLACVAFGAALTATDAARPTMKRPSGKLKILGKLADNFFHTTKAYRRATCASSIAATTHAHALSPRRPGCCSTTPSPRCAPHRRIADRPRAASTDGVRVASQWQRFAEVEKDKIAAWQRWRKMKDSALAAEQMQQASGEGGGEGER